MPIKKYPYLSDKDFLKIVDELPITTLYSRIVLLNWAEQPIQEIQGRIVGGTISINGDSAVRRTCNLSTFVDEDSYDYNTINSLFSLNKKVTLEIGVKNVTDQYTKYPILWFPQGFYVIMGISLNHSITGTTISLNLKDKMVLLNGECGGTLPASVLFNEIEETDEETGETIITKPTIYQLIQELVNHYGEIPLTQIIINDIDLQIRQVMRWLGDVPLYQTFEYDNGQRVYTYSLNGTASANTKVLTYGDDVGYIYTNFVYPDELVGEAGQNVCTILDTIKKVLGNYEYFFDIWGNFVFQEKKNYLNIRQTTFQITSGLSADDYIITNKEGMHAYDFNNSKLIISINNSPKYENIKNDFIVWGKRKTLEGLELPIRYHLAIDKKPEVRNTKVNLVLYTDDTGSDVAMIYNNETAVPKDGEKVSIDINDWRTELYVQGLEADSNFNNQYSSYYIELMNEWRKLYDLKNGKWWASIEDDMYNLDYFLDIIDENSKIGQYSVGNIGRRTQVLVDDKINCLFEPDIPDIICIESGTATTDEERRMCQAKGQPYTLVNSSIYENLGIGGTHNSAFVAIRDLLYQYTNYNESVNITMVPIFHLEPNTRIGIVDEQSGTNGDFIITTLNIPLEVTGTMSIQAIRAMEKI